MDAYEMKFVHYSIENNNIFRRDVSGCEIAQMNAYINEKFPDGFPFKEIEL